MDNLELIFREYDIRGVAGDKHDPELVELYEKMYGKFPGVTLTAETAKLIGRAYGSHLKTQGAKKVLVGFEVRPFAEVIKENFIEGISDTGIDVDDGGEMCTPFVYFLTSHLDYDGGVIITGSHNIYFYNGFKLLQKDSIPLFGKELKTLYTRIKNEEYDLDENRGKVSKFEDAYEIYKKNVLTNFNLGRKVKAVLDCGNGTTGMFAKDFFESLGIEIVEELYFDRDPKFPNHTPDPEQTKNMKDLMNSVVENGAEVGIGFDADGDRAGFVDEKGNHIPADKILLLMIKEKFAEGNEGKKVLFDVKCTKLIQDMLPDFGLEPVMHRTGHAPIKNTLRSDDDFIIGGELSGHFYFTQNYPKADDSFFAAAVVLEILSKTDKSLSELLSFIPERVASPEYKLPCADDKKFEIVKAIKEKFEEDYEVIDIDGARVTFSEDSWGLVRASNTSAYLTIRIEALDEKEVLKIKNILTEELEKFPGVEEKLNREVIADPNGRLGFI